MSTPPEKREGRPRTGPAASENFNLASTLPGRIDRFAHDALLEVMLDGERRWWLKRAEDFERAKPREGDFHGNATREDLRAAWRRCDELARACRARAHVSPVEDIREDVAALLREVS